MNEQAERVQRTSDLTARKIAATLSDGMIRTLLSGEGAIEQSPFRERDEIIGLGLARRAWPRETSGGSWQTWMTTLGVEVRDILAERRSQSNAESK